MAPKAAHEAAKLKAAKQKKILMALALPLVAALVYAVTTLSSLGSHPAAETPAAATTPAGSIPTGATAAPITPGVAPVSVDSLRSFTALGRKDPFFDAGPSGTTAPSSSHKSPSHKGNGHGSKPKPPVAPLTGAVISLNGTKLALAIGSEFGHAPGLSGVPLFRLVTVSSKTALIGVVGTRQHFTLSVGRPLTLEQNGGWKYTLILEPLGSAAPMKVGH